METMFIEGLEIEKQVDFYIIFEIEFIKKIFNDINEYNQYFKSKIPNEEKKNKLQMNTLHNINMLELYFSRKFLNRKNYNDLKDKIKMKIKDEINI